MSASTVTPSVDRTHPPDFHQMSSAAFEALTCALLDKESGVTRADLYGTPRQKQFGVDAFGETANGLVVASCKCYGRVSKGELQTWSDDFLSHLDSHWRPRKVRKFILAVAAPMHSTQRLADIDAERARFKAVGLEYDVWAPRQLQELLRDQPGIVSQHLGAEWEPRLCGRVGAVMQPPARVATASVDDLQAQLDALKQAVSGAVEQQIDAAALALENGGVAEIEALINGIRTAPSWPSLSARAQARILRLEASLQINRGDLDRAEALSGEADAIQLQEEPRLRALITMNREGAPEALQVLGVPTSDHGRTLRIGLLLNAGELDQAEADLASMPSDDPESLRLRAYLQLMRGDAAGALASASAAEAQAPQRAVVRRAGAMARYGVALSRSAPAETMSFPQPVPRNLVRQDDESQAHLRSAYEAFRQLGEAHGGEPGALDAVWALACLCNSVGRTAEATALANRILEAEPASPLAIGWALARGLEIDRGRSLAAVRAEIERGAADLNVLRAFEWLAQESEPAEAEAWLRQLPVDRVSAEFAAEILAVAERIVDPALGLLAADPQSQDAAMEALFDEVDIPRLKRAAIRAQLAKAATPAERMKIAEELRAASVMIFGRRLTEELSRNENVSLTFFEPPPASAWLDLLRWPSGADEDPVASAARTLTEDLSGWIAFDRLAGLPVRLPEGVNAAAAAAPELPEFPGGFARTPMFSFHRLYIEAPFTVRPGVHERQPAPAPDRLGVIARNGASVSNADPVHAHGGGGPISRAFRPNLGKAPDLRHRPAVSKDRWSGCVRLKRLGSLGRSGRPDVDDRPRRWTRASRAASGH